MKEDLPNAWWLAIAIGALIVVLGVIVFRLPRDTILNSRTHLFRREGGDALDPVRVFYTRFAAVAVCLMGLGVITFGVVTKVNRVNTPEADPFAPYAIVVADGVERRDAAGYAMPVALYPNFYWPDEDFFDDVPGMPGSAVIVVATVHRPTHIVVGESDDRITVTAYIECEVPPGEPVPATRPASPAECPGAAFERGPDVWLLPVDLAEYVVSRTVVDGADGTVLPPY